MQTIFITEFFKINFSQLKIKFSEENSFFEEDLIKQQSFPFKIPRKRAFIPFFKFIDSHNSVDSNKYIEGVLLRNDKYYKAELLVIRIAKEIEVVIYYSFIKFSIFDRKLNSLDWQTINFSGSNIFQFAEQKISEDYPQTPINFVTVNDEDKYKDYDFGTYSGFINHNENGEFLEGYNLGITTIYKMNEMRPFIYIKEIITFIFNQIGYTVQGDFINNESIKKALQYHNNSIFYTNNDFNRTEDFTVTLSESDIPGYNPSNLVYNEYINSMVIYNYGTYNVLIDIEGEFPAFVEGQFELRCFYNNEIINSSFISVSTQSNTDSTQFSKQLNFSFDVPKEFEEQNLEIRVICTNEVYESLTGEFNITGTLRPLYKEYISLKELLPDITVGDYIKALKETFVLTTIYNQTSQIVEINFFDSFINQQTAINLSKYSIYSVPRKLNKLLGYKIPFNDGEVLNLNRDGEFTIIENGFKDKEIPLQPLPVYYNDAQPNVKHQEGLSIVFFKSNSNALPLVNDTESSYTRIGFVHQFLRNWLYQKLNSEEYNLTLNLPIYIASKINSNSKVFFYNNFFLIHSLKRENINSLFERVNIRAFKLKNTPTFDLVIDDGSGNTEFSAPIIFTSASASAIYQTEFETTLQTAFFGWDPPYFNIEIFADQSTDPQGLSLSFGWEIISSPEGNTLGTFNALNNNNSNVIFTNSGYLNVEGEYFIRLTVINSAGLSSSQDLHVIVNPPQGPGNKIILTKIPDPNDPLNAVGKFSISFTDDFAPAVVVLNIQKFNLLTQQNEGSPVIETITDLSQPFYEVIFPSSGTWKISATSGDEYSNTLSWF